MSWSWPIWASSRSLEQKMHNWCPIYIVFIENYWKFHFSQRSAVQGHCKKKLHSSCLCHILLWKMIKSKKLIQRLYVPEIMSSHWVLVTWRKKVHSFLSNREYLGYNIFSVGVSIVSLITVPQLTIVHCTPTRNIFLTTTCIYIMTHLLYFKMIANHWVGGVLPPFLDQSVEILC